MNVSLQKTSARRVSALEVIPTGAALAAMVTGVDLRALDDTAFGAASEVTPKFVSPSDPAAQWTGAAMEPCSPGQTDLLKYQAWCVGPWASAAACSAPLDRVVRIRFVIHHSLDASVLGLLAGSKYRLQTLRRNHVDWIAWLTTRCVSLGAWLTSAICMRLGSFRLVPRAALDSHTRATPCQRCAPS